MRRPSRVVGFGLGLWVLLRAGAALAVEPVVVPRAVEPVVVPLAIHLGQALPAPDLLAGRVGLMGTQTHADRNYGDSLVLTYGLDGKLLSEHYHFTGTANDVVAMDGATTIGAFGKKLYVAGYIWPYAKNHVGEWRDPNGYTVNHPAADAPASDFTLVDVKPVVLDLGKAAARNGSELKSLVWNDVTASVTIGTPKQQTDAAHGQQTQFYLFTFGGLL